jgi:hypothetical protein
MKKTILALAFVAGLTSFAGNAKAAIIIQNLNLTYSNPEPGAPGSAWYNFGFKSGSFNDGYVGGIATNQFTIETGGVDGSLNSIQPWLWSYGGNDLSYSIANTSSLVSAGQTVDGSLSFSEGPTYPTYLGTEPNTPYYIGLQSDGYFGVATLRLDNGTVGGNGYGFVLDRIAFNNVSGQGIVAGSDTAAVPAGVPEASQVAASVLLLVGISGFVFLKRKKAVSA